MAARRRPRRIKAAAKYPPNLGSGIAAKQYDPGAPFFSSGQAVSWVSSRNDKRETQVESPALVYPTDRPFAYRLGRPGGASPLKTSLFFSMKATY
jgi:hypothetical protein